MPASAADEIAALEQFIGNRHAISDHALVNNFVHDPLLPSRLRTWCGLNGIPRKSAQSAKAESLARAYINPNYLAAWRKNVNPEWDLLGNLDNDETLIVSTEPSQPKQMPSPMPQPATAPAVVDVNAIAAAVAKVLLDNLNARVDNRVDNKLSGVTLKIDDGAKAQIRQLATSAATDVAQAEARRLVNELMPPRQIEIKQAETGHVVNVGLQHDQFPTLLRAINTRDHRGFRLNIWLTGPTGSGKTTAGENASKALTLAFGCESSLDNDYKVLGFRDANGNVVSTQFLDIYANGGIFIADEIDNWMPSALLSLNAALANGWCPNPKGLIKRHADACIIACANTWGHGATNEYVGRSRLDAASLDRFQPKINWHYDEKLERAIAIQMDPTLGPMWFNIVRSMRAKVSSQGLKIIVSPRATYNGLSLLHQDFPALDVALMTFAAGLSDQQIQALGLSSTVAQHVQEMEQARLVSPSMPQSAQRVPYPASVAASPSPLEVLRNLERNNAMQTAIDEHPF